MQVTIGGMGKAGVSPARQLAPTQCNLAPGRLLYWNARSGRSTRPMPPKSLLTGSEFEVCYSSGSGATEVGFLAIFFQALKLP